MDHGRPHGSQASLLLVIVAAIVAAGALVAVPAGAVIPKPPEPTTDAPGAEKYHAIVDAATSQLASELGVSPLSKTPLVGLLKKKTGPGQYAHTWYYDDGTCLVELQPAGQTLTGADLEFTLTHEVAHCYQNRETGGADVTDWVEEGAATWAAAKLAPGSAIAKSKWGPYLAQPGTSLYSRSYDAIGFFGHLEQVGVDVWTRIVKMMQAGGDDAAFAIGTADNATVLDHWPTGLARDGSLGPAWETSGPDIPATSPPRAHKSVSNGSASGVSVAKAANAIVDLDVDADVVTFDAAATAHGRMRDAAGTDRLIADVAGRPLCALASGCVCPDGTPAAGATLATMAPGSAILGITGGPAPAKVSVTGRSLDDFCANPAKVDPCIVGTWTGQGVTINLPNIEIVGSGGQGAVLKFEKNGTGSVDLDPSAPVEATLPGDLVGTFALRGQAGGLVTASKGVMRTITTTVSNMHITIDVPPLGGQDVPLGAGDLTGAPFDGLYTCSKTTFVYTAPAFGGQSTWTRQ